MSAPAAFGSSCLLAAALVGVVAPRLAPLVRLLATLGALAAFSTLESSAVVPLLALVVGAAVLATPLPLLLGAGAAIAGLRPESAGAPVFAAGASGLAAAAAAGAVWSEARACWGKGAGASGGSEMTRARVGWTDTGWAAVVGGASLTLLLLVIDGGSLLRWSFGAGSGPARVELPGVGLLLGLALLGALGGTLGLAANLLAPSVAGARRFAQRLLILAVGLCFLGIGLALVRAAELAPGSLAAAGRELAGLVTCTGLLGTGLALLLGAPVEADAERWRLRSRLETRAAAFFSVAAGALAGYEGWLRLGGYAGPTLAAYVAVALLGLAALEPTRLGLGRRLAFLIGLLTLVL